MKEDAAGDEEGWGWGGGETKTKTKQIAERSLKEKCRESLPPPTRPDPAEPSRAEPVWEPPLNWKSILSDDRQALEAPGR